MMIPEGCGWLEIFEIFAEPAFLGIEQNIPFLRSMSTGKGIFKTTQAENVRTVIEEHTVRTVLGLSA
jgi:hypothetical protein